MTKNEIITKVIEKLLYQREELTNELINLNYNENNYFDKKSTVELAISNIDMQLDRRIMDCEQFVAQS